MAGRKSLVRAGTTVDQMVRAIADRIVTGLLRPGEKLDENSLAGQFSGTIDLDPGPDQMLLAAANTDLNDFVAKYSPNGVPLWAQRLGDEGSNPSGLGGIHVANESYDASRISSLGYPTRVSANSEIRYHFSPQKSVPDERLFGNVTAVLTVEGTDDTGARTQASTAVTVTR